MRINVFDVEANGLTPDLIWCLCANFNGKLRVTSEYKNMIKFLTEAEVLVGHNIIRWDIPNLERVLGIKIKAKLVDTLALSWYLEPKRVVHGLEAWGEYFGIPKPPVVDWNDPELQGVYEHRCHEDVEINSRLWDKFWKHLLKLYGNADDAWKCIDYLMFKMDCAREQEEVRWKLDVDRCSEGLRELTQAREDKVVELAGLMPKLPVVSKRERPKKSFLKTGEESKLGEAWFGLLKDNDLPRDYTGVVEVVTGYKEPNPGSSPQLKSWLYSLGWKPMTFEFKRDKETGDVRKIEQINLKHGQGLCPSIKELFDIEPGLVVLDGLSILTHRISILNGFLTNVDSDGYIQAQIQGLTNTLRFKHKVAVNLPGVDKAYGELIRGCLICPEGYELCGADMCSLEDTTKRHYMYPHDPDYVEEMSADDFDPHLNLAMFAKALTPQQVAAHAAGTQDHSKIRKAYKAVNYASVYGAGGATVSRAAGVTEAEGHKLVEAYWKRNWSVNAIAEEQVVKVCMGQKWLYNPVSGLWYSLRHEKDRFSTLNQGTGVYCFDNWMKHCRDGGPPTIAQFHDEGVWLVRLGQRDKCTKHLKNAIHYTNEELKLNLKLDVDIQFGMSYAEIH